jgi:hypothetical protein
MSSARPILTAYYLVTIGLAVIGQGHGAAQSHWLPLPWYVAGLAGMPIELGAITVLHFGAARRQLKERAIPARLLSAGIAALAVYVNLVGNLDHHSGGKTSLTLVSVFFAGQSLIGYLIYCLDSESRRRDRLRISGDLAEAPPTYDLVGHWLRHPVLTVHARSLAKADPDLGTYGSFALARTELVREKRERKIAAELRDLVSASVEPRLAKIAALTLDPAEIAARLAANADYDGLAAMLGEKLTADAVMRGDRKRPRTGRTTTPDRTAPDRTASIIRTGLQNATGPAPVRQSAQVNPSPTPDRATGPDRSEKPAHTPTHSAASAPQPDRTTGPDRTDDNVESIDSGRIEVLDAIRRAVPECESWDGLRAAVANPRNKTITLNEVARRARMGKSRINKHLPHATDEQLPYLIPADREATA